jgi:site-specific DNA-methyltransferase (adenine-specific)
MKQQNQLYYGNNLEVLQNNIADESVDLCYIDPPFNSNHDYNQIYNNIGKDIAQSIAFTDTWEWDKEAIKGFQRFNLVKGDKKIPEKTKILITSLHKILGENGMLAYIISISQRIIEIHRVLKPTGSFYLHCDPTASHYLKLVLDSVFVENGGTFRNEIVWCYTGPGSPNMRQFNRKHDVIFWYTKSNKWVFNKDKILLPYKGGAPHKGGFTEKDGTRLLPENYTEGKVPETWWTDIAIVARSKKERLGYQTQKPEKLMERIILASSNEKDVVLDAYCGCGTTVAVAQRLKRKWIGIDITYQSISVILKRLEDSFGKKVINNIELSGIPKDIDSAAALAHKKDDSTRKEFEKWAVITYSNDNAKPREKKGADKGIDGIMHIYWNIDEEIKDVLFSVKSGHVTVSQIRDFLHVIEREKAASGIFITFEEPTKPMLQEAKNAGTVTIPLTKQSIDKLQIVTIQQILNGARANFPLAIDPLKKAERKTDDNQLEL